MYVVQNVTMRAKEKKQARVYFFVTGETIAQDLVNRRARPYNELRKLLPEVIKRAGIPTFVTKARWSQKAGCSCPCSPGFILDGICSVDLYVDVTPEAAQN